MIVAVDMFTVNDIWTSPPHGALIAQLSVQPRFMYKDPRARFVDAIDHLSLVLLHKVLDRFLAGAHELFRSGTEMFFTARDLHRANCDEVLGRANLVPVKSVPRAVGDVER